MGTPNADGSITWAEEEQIVHDGYNHWVSIAVDSNGYPWVAYAHSDDGATWYPYVNKSSKKDGTWVNDTGFPHQLSSISEPYSYWFTIVLPLTDGKVYILYNKDGEKILGILWNGGWGSEETCTTTVVDLKAYSAVAEGDDIHVVFRGGVFPKCDLRYVKRTYGVGWGTEVFLKDLTNLRLSSHISIDSKGGNLYIFLGNTADNILELKIYRAGAWVDWFVNWTEPNTLCSMPIAFYQKFGRAIGVAWVRGASSPYEIRYEILTILPTVLKNTPNSGF